MSKKAREETQSMDSCFVVCINSAFCQLKKITITVCLLAPVCTSVGWGLRGVFPQLTVDQGTLSVDVMHSLPVC